MTTRAIKPTRRGLALTGAALLLSALIALVSVASVSGKAADVLGKVGGKAPPSCPTPNPGVTPGDDPKFCQAFASVTGFQMVANGQRAAFKAPSEGHIVAWSVDMSEPSKNEQSSFVGQLDFGEPAARLAILKGKGKSKFKLTKQSPKVQLSGQLGREPVFTLANPLRVEKGAVIGLSTSNWVPNLAHDGKLTEENDKWRASRGHKKCGTDSGKSVEENRRDILSSKAQRKVGTTRTYGCTYFPSRILYQAFFVPSN